MVWYYFFSSANHRNSSNYSRNNNPTKNDDDEEDNNKTDDDEDPHAQQQQQSQPQPQPAVVAETDDDQSRLDPRFLKAWWTRRLHDVEQSQQQRRQRQQLQRQNRSSSSSSSAAAAAAATSSCYFGGCGSGEEAGAASSTAGAGGGCDNSSIGVSVADTDCTPVISNLKSPFHQQHKKQKPSLSSIPQISSFEENNYDIEDLNDNDEEQQQQIKRQRQRKRRRKMILLSFLSLLLVVIATTAAIVAILQHQKNQSSNASTTADDHHDDSTTTFAPTPDSTAPDVQFQQSTPSPDEDVSVVTVTKSTPAPTPPTLILESYTMAPSSSSSYTNNNNNNTTASSTSTSSSEQDWIITGEYPGGAFGSTLGIFQDTILIGAPNNTSNNQGGNTVVSMYRFSQTKNTYQRILTVSSALAGDTGTSVAMIRGRNNNNNNNNNDTVVFAISQPTQTIGGQPRRGMVQVYETTNDTDGESAIALGSKLHGPGPFANFGSAIDMVASSSSRGPFLVVGAPFYTQSLRFQGSVSVYEYQDQNQQWTALGVKEGDEAAAAASSLVGNHSYEWWGSAVALCEHEQHLYMAASAPREEETSGYVALYEYKTTSITTTNDPNNNNGDDDAERDATSYGSSNGIWELIGFASNVEMSTSTGKTANVNDHFGASLDLQCNNEAQRVRLAIGIPQVDNGAGMVVVYEYSRAAVVDSSTSISWNQIGNPIVFSSSSPMESTSSPEFGTSVVWIDENRLAVGAPGANDRTGAVEIWQVSSSDGSSSSSFQLVDSKWGIEHGDEFGSALATTSAMRKYQETDGVEDQYFVSLLAAGAPQSLMQGQSGYVRIWNIDKPMNPS